jgi:ATP-binding cassette subfamily B protein
MKESAVKWLYKNTKGQRLNILWLILSNAFFALMTVSFAYVIKIIIDGAVSGNKNQLIAGAVAIVVLVLLQFVFRLIINGLTEHIRAKLEIIYKSILFGEILKKRYKDVTKYHSGELLNRLTSDVNVIAEGISSIVPTAIASFVRLVAAVIVLVFIDWVFAIAFVVAGLLVFATLGLLRGKLKFLHKKTQETEGKTRSFMQECLENSLAIKVFSVADKIKGISNDLQQKNFKVKMKRRNYNVLGNATYNFIFSAGYIFALIFGAVKLFQGTMGFGYGDLSAILQLVNSVQVPIASLSGLLPKFYGTVASAERLMEIEELDSDSLDGERADAKKLYNDMKYIDVRDVDFSYDDDNKVLIDCSCRINKGDFVSITGMSGIGKSTLFKILMDIYPKSKGDAVFVTDDGEITVNGLTRTMFAYVPQGNMLFSGTLRDNLLFMTDADTVTDERIENALKCACADSFVSGLPNGLDTVIGENGVGLSEGQIQRLALARAILSDCPILLLDEATSALDENTEAKVLSNIKSLTDKTCLIVTHKKAALDICTKHFVIKDGKIGY